MARSPRKPCRSSMARGSSRPVPSHRRTAVYTEASFSTESEATAILRQNGFRRRRRGRRGAHGNRADGSRQAAVSGAGSRIIGLVSHSLHRRRPSLQQDLEVRVVRSWWRCGLLFNRIKACALRTSVMLQRNKCLHNPASDCHSKFKPAISCMQYSRRAVASLEHVDGVSRG